MSGWMEHSTAVTVYDLRIWQDFEEHSEICEICLFGILSTVR